MHIQGKRLKEGKEPQKGVLNEFADSRIITFTEPEVGDMVDVEYQLTEGDKGYFAEEYRPNTIAKEDAKVIDITACIINEKKGICCWWLYDLKKDVGGQDVIRHLCEQWQAAYSYLSNSVLNFLIDISIVPIGSIGVITRNFDTDRIRAEFEKLDETIKEMEENAKQTVLLARRKSSVRLPELRAERKLLENTLNKKVCFPCSGKYLEFTFDVRISEERANGAYYDRLTCSHDFVDEKMDYL